MNWKDIVGYEGYYQVSDTGEVRSLIMWDGAHYCRRKEPFLLSKANSSTGYYNVGLCKNNKRSCRKVHRLVAEAFIPNEEGKPQVNHKDGNKRNNNVENLEWVTSRENLVHALDTGLRNRNVISKEKLELLVDEGYTVKEISGITHISIGRLMAYYKKYGVRNNFNKYQIDKDEMKKAIDDGKSNAEIAKMFNCSSNLVAVRRYQMKKGMY